MKEVFVVCKNFNTPEVLFYERNNGWNLDKVDMFASESEAYLLCANELTMDNVSLERFVTQQRMLLQ